MKFNSNLNNITYKPDSIICQYRSTSSNGNCARENTEYINVSLKFATHIRRYLRPRILNHILNQHRYSLSVLKLGRHAA